MPFTSLAGQFLIAMPSMSDRRFDHSVIYLCSHDKNGAMGLVVNRTNSRVNIGDIAEQIGLDTADKLETEVAIFDGGPVDQSRGFVLHEPYALGVEDLLMVSGNVHLSASVEMLERIFQGHGPKRFLFALGYAGWGPGQLERELVENVWVTLAENMRLLFDMDVDQKWETAFALLGIDPKMISSQGGRA